MSREQKSELAMGRKVAEALANGGQVAGKRIAGLAEDGTYFVVEIVGATEQGVDAKVIHTGLTREVADGIVEVYPLVEHSMQTAERKMLEHPEALRS